MTAVRLIDAPEAFRLAKQLDEWVSKGAEVISIHMCHQYWYAFIDVRPIQDRTEDAL